MSRLEDQKLKLHPSDIHLEGAKVVVEERASRRLLILPKESESVLPLLDGTRTVKEIVAHLYKRDRRVSFRVLYETVQALRGAKFLEGSDDAAEVRRATDPGQFTEVVFEKQPLLTERWVLRLNLASRLRTGARARPLFWVLAVAVTVLGVLSATLDPYWAVTNQFLSIENGVVGNYAAGVAFFFAAGSVLMTLRTLIDAALLTLATGHVYGVQAVLGLTSASLRVKDSSIYLANGTRVPAMYYAASMSGYFCLTGLAEIALGSGSPILAQLWPVALFLTLLDVNPYCRSNLTKLLYLKFREALQGHLLSYVRNRALFSFVGGPKGESRSSEETARDNQLVIYSVIALGWSSAFIWAVSNILQANSAQLFMAMRAPDTLDRVASGLIFGALVASSVYFLGDLLLTLAKNLLFPMAAPVFRALRGSLSRREAITAENRPALRAVFENTPLFHGLRVETIEALLSGAEVTRFRRGARVLVQGQPNAELFAVLSGTVSVRRRESTGATRMLAYLGAGALFGEVSAFHDAPVTAEVVAEGDVRLLVIHRDGVQRLRAGEHQGDVQTILDRILLGHYVASSQIFREVPKELIQLVTHKGKIRRFAAGATIIEQGAIERSFELLVHGKVEVLLGGKRIGDIEQGGFFGEIALIADTPRTATIRALEDCVIFEIGEGAFWEILAEHFQLSLFIEAVAEQRAATTEEIAHRQAS